MTIKGKVFVSVVTLLAIICSCNRGTEVLDKAEQMVRTNPDSSLVVLSSIDRTMLSKSERARYGLLFTMAQDKSGLDVDMDTLIRFSYIYYKGMPDTKYYGLSQYYMGKYYMLNDSTRECEACFRNTIDNAKKRGDIDLQCLALEKFSRSIVLSNTKQSIAYARQALELYKTSKTKKLSNVIYYALNLANSFILDDQKDSALTYLRQAKGLLNDKQEKRVISDVYYSLCRAFYYFNDTDSALFYSHKALEIEQKDKLLIFHAFCLEQSDSIEAAEKILRDCVNNSNDGVKYTLYMDLCKMSARKIGNQYSNDIDSLEKYAEKDMLDLYSLKGRYLEDNIRQGRELERQENEVLIRNYSIAFIIVIAVLISIILYVLYSKKKALQRQELLYQEERHELIVESKDKQIALMKSSLFEKLELAQKINDARGSKGHILINDNDWRQLYAILEGGDDYFISRLKKSHPNLNDDDIHLCMLVKIGLSNEDISNIYCITPASIKKKLYCFKEKLNIADCNLSVREYLKSF